MPDSTTIKCSMLPPQPATAAVRVLFLSDHLAYPSGVVHGASRYFLEVLPRIDRSRIELTVCFLRERHPLATQLEQHRIEPLFLDRRKWDPRALLDLIALIRRRRIEVVHAAGFKGMLAGRIAARATGCRAIIHLHDLDRPTPLVRRLLRPGGRWADLALGVSRPVCKLAIEDFGIPAARVRLMYNAVDFDRYRHVDRGARPRLRRELQIPPNAPVVAVVGRFYPAKGHLALIDAWADVHARLPEAILLCVGDGPDRPRCEAIVDQRQLRAAVRFAGQRDDIPELLSAIDLVAIPSLSEGLPFAALEALAAARPLVGFDVGGLPEVILDGQTGRLIPAGDQPAFVDALVDLLTDPAQRQQLSAGCLRHVQHFGIAAHVEQLEAIYQTLAGREVPSLHSADEGWPQKEPS